MQEGPYSLCSSLALHTLALASDGTLFAFGHNHCGQTGSSSLQCVLVPTEVSGIGKVPVSVACGLDFSLVLCEDNSLFAFGANQRGQLGQGHTRPCSGPQLVGGFDAKIVSVACGAQFALVVTSSGAVYGWGINTDGQLLLVGEKNSDVLRPTRLQLHFDGENDSVIQVSCGSGHVLALTRFGRVLSWGRNKNRQLGRSASDGLEIALFDGGATHKAVAVACGSEHSFVMTEMGRLFGFGSNAFGQLGISMSDHSFCDVPTEVTFFADKQQTLVKSLSCGAHHTVVLSDDGRVFVCGWNEYGQLGIPRNRSDDDAAAAIDDAGERWLAIGQNRIKRESSAEFAELRVGGSDAVIVAVGCGREHSFALSESGEMFAWGFGGLGQLGSGTQTDAPEPVHVAIRPGTRFVRIGSLVLGRESRESVIRRQALYLHKEMRRLEELRASLPSNLAASSSSVASNNSAGMHRKRSGSAPAKHKKLLCPSCQKHLKKGLHFCNHCGHKIENSSNPSSPDTLSHLAKIVEEKEVVETEENAPAVIVAPVITAAAPPVVELPKETLKGSSSVQDNRNTLPETLKVSSSVQDNPNTPKPTKLLGGTTPQSRNSGSKLPKMSSLQQVLFDMPSPMPVTKLAEEENPTRRSSLDTLEKAKVVSSRLSGREDAHPVSTAPPTKVCPKCGQSMPPEDRALGPEGKQYHIKCL